MKRFIAAIALLGLGACGAEAPGELQAAAQTAPAATLPDQLAVKANDASGKPTLQGWRTTAAPASHAGLRYYSVHIEPENPAFAGAKAFMGSWEGADPIAAARTAAAAEGFTTTRVLAQASVDPAITTRLEPGGKVTSVLLDGTLSGKPARFAGWVWYGALGEPDGKAGSGVNGFVAPEPAFVALGGYAVPAILSGIAVATPDTPMSVDGAKPADIQAKELVDLFAGWAAQRSSNDGLALNMIMQGNLGVTSGTGCINTLGCVGGGQAPVYTPPRY